jgi:4-aminobutyrate aminotransferase
MATVDGIAEVLPQVPKLSEHAFRRFNELNDQHHTIGEVRGLGLMIGVELVGPDGHTPSKMAIDEVRRYCLSRHMMVLPCGPDENVIRFIPPLNVSLEDLDHGIDIIAAGLAAYEG